MKDIVNDIEIAVDCDCGETVKATIRSLRRSTTLHRPNGHAIQVDASQMDRELQGVDAALTDLHRALSKFPKPIGG
jgi:hypothetical protein